ncbi:putative FBD-associated F-box protein At5g56430 [Rosa rugosa]|uniref:putative FBD-associated F-box protein At5g56430 n=1 Tax=Rosa rugosa TaxID=74645 RepID=UPI002B407755|nr:putative FBD-associated F-box protein At5g56430 [Rosa rugosa]
MSFCLTNSSSCMKACHLPIFRNLRQLELVLHYCCSWWPELLKTSPNLESLVLDHSRHPSWRMDSCEFTWLQWNSPESVPSCVLSQLKTICTRNFRGGQDEMKVAKYMLEKGQVLKSLTLYTAHLVCTKEKLCMQLLMFYRGSKTCHVELK